MKPTSSILLLCLLAACADRSESEHAPRADTLTLAERRGIAARIAFVSERGASKDVWMMTAAGEDLRRLTSGPTEDYPAGATRDGSALAVISAREDSAGSHGEQLSIHWMDGRPRWARLPASARVRGAAWAPDGRWLVVQWDRESFADLYRVEVPSGAVRRLTDDPQGNFDPEVSPDGGWIAFASSRDDNAEVYVMRADGSDERRLTAFHQDDWGPRWSSDGRWIAFLSNREVVSRIFLVRPDGTGIRRLTASTDSLAEGAFAWSPDGASIAFQAQARGGAAHIHAADVRTGRVAKLADGGEGGAFLGDWSPDGRYLAFWTDRGGGTAIWLMRADGSAPTRLTHSPAPDWLPRWIPGR